MRKLSLALAITALGLTAPSAFGAANPESAPCIALFTSNTTGRTGRRLGLVERP